MDKRFGRQQILLEDENKEIKKEWKYKFQSQIPLPKGYEL
jgi:hypothetical protein